MSDSPGTDGASGGLFGPIFAPDDPDGVQGETGDEAWLQAMLDAEAALAAAQAGAGLISDADAGAIRSRCKAELFDAGELGREGRAAGNPVVPLVKRLTAEVDKASGTASRQVHRGATSQDILDTAAMLVAARALAQILPEIDGLAAECAALAEDHRATLMAGRTLMQQALPVTFGLKAAGWLVALIEARRGLHRVRRDRLAVQLGGAAGTLASLGAAGPAVLSGFATELGLAEPVVPWHSNRVRVADLVGALAACAGAVEKISGDVILMSQTEVGEVAEPSGGGRGGSSTLPHKRNPILSVTASASVRRARAAAHTLQSSMDHEHERAAGAWHAEWQALSEALSATGGSVATMREATGGLEVYPGRMRRNLDATGGLIMAENVSTALTGELGRLQAHELVQAACERVSLNGTGLEQELLSEPEISRAISEEELDSALDPGSYLGSAQTFVDRALALYNEEVREMRDQDG
ncbi:3-carboxy-cis,cis-muconate cycloisomerase [Rubrobacter aplysinae]|uniref:3-carboxy-cis,cis-muconate cycloisomerase n=1 Tax=Rubrobacter aplysinae TaxID=909625 RepID=UPI000A88117A|nr:3-carboxy-cis,cis-muconate cycloisomerase [Rubrobacter aplysinae]